MERFEGREVNGMMIEIKRGVREKEEVMKISHLLQIRKWIRAGNEREGEAESKDREDGEEERDGCRCEK
jgi:hypothetical protein